MLLLVVAAVQENYFAEWRNTQREYRRILLSKAEDEGQVNAARRFSVEIRQIEVLDLDRVDRCVRCHLGVGDPRMGEEPQPFTRHSGEYLQDHDVEKFGCTICHLG